jgi:ATP-dependent Clp protease protease subunit
MATRKNHNDIDTFMNDGLYVPTRTISMGGESIDYDQSEQVIKNLHILDNLNNDPITILMNSNGGDCDQGMSIYEAIRLCKSHVTVKVIGQVQSMAAWILQIADHRIMSKNSRLMVHTGTMGLSDDHPENNKKWMKQWEKDEIIFEDILLEKIKLKHIDFTRKKIKDMLRFDTILTPEEALELGLIDEII